MANSTPLPQRLAFIVDGGAPCTLADMLAANSDDDEVCVHGRKPRTPATRSPRWSSAVQSRGSGGNVMLTIVNCWNHGCRLFAMLPDGRTITYTGEFDTQDAARKMAARVGDFGRVASLNWREVD